MAKWHIDLVPSFDLLLRSSPVILYHPEYDPPIYWGGKLYYWLCFLLIVDKTDEMKEQYRKLKEAMELENRDA